MAAATTVRPSKRPRVAACTTCEWAGDRDARCWLAADDARVPCCGSALKCKNTTHHHLMTGRPGTAPCS